MEGGVGMVLDKQTKRICIMMGQYQNVSLQVSLFLLGLHILKS